MPRCRLGIPDDLGKDAVFVASDDSAHVAGMELFVTAVPLSSEGVPSAASIVASPIYQERGQS